MMAYGMLNIESELRFDLRGLVGRRPDAVVRPVRYITSARCEVRASVQ